MASFRPGHACLPLLLLFGCADAEGIVPPSSSAVIHSVSFVGFVYDGATGDRVSAYTLGLQVAAETQPGALEEDGRYTTERISVWDDFTVVLDADGYRPFRSHNAHIGVPAELAQSDDIADIASHQTLHFDAYVFPTSLASPPVTFTMATTTGAAPSGTLRLRPVGRSVLDDTPVETPSGVPGQLWDNDEDLQQNNFSSGFSDGQLTLSAGELVYGVTYQVNVFDVPGFQPLEGLYTAGVETDKTFNLTEEVGEPLTVVTNDVNSCVPPVASEMNGAIITIQLNQNVEEADNPYPGGAAEALDDGISISSPDANVDMVVNVLNADTASSAQERGVMFSITGDTITIAWNPSAGLITSDPADPILSVTYGGLANVVVQRAGAPSSAVPLSALVGGSLTCAP